MFGPRTRMFVVDGLDHPGNGVCVTYVTWGDLWMWDVQSWSERQGTQRVVNENGALTVETIEPA